MRQDEKQPYYIHGFIATRYDDAVPLSALLQPDLSMIRELYRRSVTVLQGRICAGKRLFREIFIYFGSWLSFYTHQRRSSLSNRSLITDGQKREGRGGGKKGFDPPFFHCRLFR